MYTMMRDDNMCIQKGTNCGRADVFCSQLIDFCEIELPSEFDQSTRASALKMAAVPSITPPIPVHEAGFFSLFGLVAHRSII